MQGFYNLQEARAAGAHALLFRQVRRIKVACAALVPDYLKWQIAGAAPARQK
jgi:hypothetical protein